MPEAQQSLGATDFQISLTIIGPTIILAFGPLFTGPVGKTQANFSVVN